MIQNFHWNTIPAAGGSVPDERKKNAFTLNHWRLIDMGEGASLEGHIHGRTDFPDGLPISTSFLLQYYRQDDCLYFETSNSMYACSLQEYILESNSIALLEQIDADSLAQKIAETRRQHYLSILKEQHLTAGIFLNWCGCDSPYLKWTVCAADGEVEIRDNGATSYEALAIFRINENNALSIGCTSSLRSGAFLTSAASENCPVFIENSGSMPLLAVIGNDSKPLCVQPGGCAAVRISFEPVYSVTH